MKTLKRHKCSCCGQMAQYRSMDLRYRNFYYCRDCKPSEGEFTMERNGFPIYAHEKYYVVSYNDLLKTLTNTSKHLKGNAFANIQDLLVDCYYNNKVVNKNYVGYNKFMSEFGEVIINRISRRTYRLETTNVYKFYVNFKKYLTKIKKDVKTLT